MTHAIVLTIVLTIFVFGAGFIAGAAFCAPELPESMAEPTHPPIPDDYGRNRLDDEVSS